jgi:hypothetical protein
MPQAGAERQFPQLIPQVARQLAIGQRLVKAIHDRQHLGAPSTFSSVQHLGDVFDKGCPENSSDAQRSQAWLALQCGKELARQALA